MTRFNPSNTKPSKRRSRSLIFLSTLLFGAMSQPFSAQKPARIPRDICQEDYDVVQAVMRDLVNNKALWTDFKGGDLVPQKEKKRIMLDNRTVSIPIPPDIQIDNDLDTKARIRQITAEMRQDLRRRNLGKLVLPSDKNTPPSYFPGSLIQWKPTDRRILVDDVGKHFKEGWFDKHFVRGDAYVAVFLPGYSPSGEKAVLRFFFGPTTHGASGTYYLRKRKGRWYVVWGVLTYYM